MRSSTDKRIRHKANGEFRKTVNGMALGQILSQSLSRNEFYRAPVKRAPKSLSGNLNRLISAAVVSPRFCGLLLSDPTAALAAGYNGEKFNLTPAEYAAVTSLRVYNVREFAAQLLGILQYASADAAQYAPGVRADFHFAEVVAQSTDSTLEQPALA
jgi:hypothetical protein